MNNLALLQNKIIVIKFGGNALTLETAKTFCQTVSKLVKHNIKPVIIHGGGPQIDALLNRLNIESNFVNGLRYTDDKTMQVVEMVLCGQVNKMLVQQLNNSGASAVGISGKDGKTLLAKQKQTDNNGTPLDLGLVGEITQVNPQLLQALLNHHFIPVIAPIAFDDKGQTLNINADYAASAIAKSLSAQALVMMTNIAGLLDIDKNIIHQAPHTDIIELIKKGVIVGGMIPKTLSAIEALQSVNEIKIIDGRDADNLIKSLSNQPVGTTITR